MLPGWPLRFKLLSQFNVISVYCVTQLPRWPLQCLPVESSTMWPSPTAIQAVFMCIPEISAPQDYFFLQIELN